MQSGWFLVWECLVGGRAQLKLCSTCIRIYLDLIFWDLLKVIYQSSLSSWKRIIYPLGFDYLFNPFCIPEVYTFKCQSRCSRSPFCLSLLSHHVHHSKDQERRRPPPLASLKIWGELMRSLRISLTHPDSFQDLELCFVLCYGLETSVSFVFIATSWSLLH